MIGQKALMKHIAELCEYHAFPRFTILCGGAGSGKKLMAAYIAEQLGATLVMSGISIDDVREVLYNAMFYNMKPVLYVFADADKMSNAAKNSLLKICEEPPRNTYILLTVTDMNYTLNTLRSRAYSMYMQSYTPDQLDEYYKSEINESAEERAIVCKVCTTPGEVKRMSECDAVELREFTYKVRENIAEVSGANALKIGTNIRFKEGGSGTWDMDLFLLMFRAICQLDLNKDVNKYSQGIIVASATLAQMNIKGINKSALFDKFVLDIREAWNEPC